MTGLSPHTATLRQLVAAATAKQESDWDHTASLIAMLHNTNCSKQSQTKSPLDFHPFRARTRAVAMTLDAKESVEHLRQILIPAHCQLTTAH